LHDIGKIGIPDAILRKPAQLTADEWQQMREHPALGQAILRDIKFLSGAARVVGQHHEKWDGSGYPLGLKGSEIDLNARVFAVADAFDAITSNRVYRAGASYESAVTELETYAGRQFDPQIIAAFRRIPAIEWEQLRARSLEKVERQGRASFSQAANASTAQASASLNSLTAFVALSHQGSRV
jgi:HD-GYP domain-containing protein (c-di-GMP phosphodiesterase class II)